MAEQKWEWHYSALTGVMYGPVPVGIIGVALVAAVYFATKH